MRNVLITGANKGLGFELTKFLLNHGCFVYLGCVTPGWTSTDFNWYSGGKSANENCINLAKYAMLDQTGPTGKCLGKHWELTW